MTEESLSKMAINELFDLMVKQTTELLEMHKKQEKVNVLDDKRKEIEMIQKVIIAKRAAEIP
jgi:hypothetical protein